MSYPGGMRSDYNKRSEPMLQVLGVAMPYIKKGVDAHDAKIAPDSPTIIADFGSSAGANSSAAMSHVIRHFRDKYGDKFDILTVHNDVPQNNWNELFRFVDEDPRSYLQKSKGVYSLASAKSFYRQVLPRNCLHFGYSSLAVQWLSCLPVQIANHVLWHGGSDDERQLFKLQAAVDWESFLMCRSAELVQGGVLVLDVMSDDNGAVPTLLGDSLYQAVLRLRDEQNVICDEEVRDFSIPVYMRSLEEIIQPALFEELGFEVVVAEPTTKKTLFQQRQSGESPDAATFVSMMSVNFEPIFVGALLPSRSDDEKKAICEKLWQNLSDIVKTMPSEKFATEPGHVMVVLKKK